MSEKTPAPDPYPAGLQPGDKIIIQRTYIDPDTALTLRKVRILEKIFSQVSWGTHDHGGDDITIWIDDLVGVTRAELAIIEEIADA